MQEPPRGSDSQPAAPGARCGMHPERPALGVCRRCGNYMCHACSSGGRFLRCPPCRARDGIGAFPFSRDHWTFDGLLGHCFATWREHAITLGLATLLLFAAPMVLSVLGSVFQALSSGNEGASLAIVIFANVVQMVVQLGLQVGMLAMCFEAVDGRPPDLANLALAFRRVPAAFLQLLIFYLVGGGLVGMLVAVAFAWTGEFLSEATFDVYAVGTLVLLVPAIYMGLGIVFSMFELARNPRASALGAIATSWRTVRGHRWAVLAMLIVNIVLGVLGLIACCVGTLVTYPLGVMLLCALYLALSNTERPMVADMAADVVEAGAPLVDTPSAGDTDPNA